MKMTKNKLECLFHIFSVLSVMIFLNNCKTPEPAFKPDLKVYRCNEASEAITIDGKFSEPDWQTTSPVTRFYSYIPGKPPQIISNKSIQARFLYDKKYLYLAVRIMDEDIITDPRARQIVTQDTIFSEGDIFELFLYVNPQDTMGNRYYYEIHVYPDNRFWDARHEGPLGGKGLAESGKWNSGLLSAVFIYGRKDDKTPDWGWNIELEIPWESLSENGKSVDLSEGKSINFSICYIDRTKGFPNADMISSSKFPIPWFHLIGSYDTLIFHTRRTENYDKTADSKEYTDPASTLETQ